MALSWYTRRVGSYSSKVGMCSRDFRTMGIDKTCGYSSGNQISMPCGASNDCAWWKGGGTGALKLGELASEFVKQKPPGNWSNLLSRFFDWAAEHC